MRLKSTKLVKMVEHFASDVGVSFLSCLDVLKCRKSLEEIKPKIITPFIFKNITANHLTFSYFLLCLTIATLHLNCYGGHGGR